MTILISDALVLHIAMVTQDGTLFHHLSSCRAHADVCMNTRLEVLDRFPVQVEYLGIRGS